MACTHIEKEYYLYTEGLEGNWFKITYTSNRKYRAIHYRIISDTKIEAYECIGCKDAKGNVEYTYYKQRDPYKIFSAQTIQNLYNKNRREDLKLRLCGEPKQKATVKTVNFDFSTKKIIDKLESEICELIDRYIEEEDKRKEEILLKRIDIKMKRIANLKK